MIFCCQHLKVFYQPVLFRLIFLLNFHNSSDGQKMTQQKNRYFS